MRQFTTYDPTRSDTDVEDELEFKRENLNEMVVDDRDIALLRVITKVVDSRLEQDFDQLYSAFEEYIKANGVKNRTQCLNILVNLCKYTEATWGGRLEKCLEDYNLGEYAKRRDANLNQRLAYFNMLKKKRYLEWWSDRQEQMAEYDERLGRAAVMRDTNALRREAFSQWAIRFDGYERMQVRADRFADRTVKRQVLKNMRMKAERHKQLSTNLNKFVFQKFFARWTSKYQDVAKLNELAEQMSQHNLETSFLTDWAYASVEQQIENRYNATILRDAFGTWQANTDRLVVLSTAAEKRDFEDTAKKTLSKWQARLETAQNDTQISQQMYEENTLRRVFGNWQRAASVCHTSAPYVQTMARDITRDYFVEWRLRTMQSRESTRFRRFMLLFKFMRTWRLEAGVRRVREAHDYRLAQQTLKNWILQERLQMFQRYSDSLLQLETLRHWQEEHQFSSQRLEENEAQVSAFVADGIKRRMFGGWVDRTADVLELEQTGDQIYQCTLQKRTVDRMFGMVMANNSLHSTAVELEYDKSTRRVFKLWLEKAHTRKQERLDAICQQFASDRDQRLKSQLLNTWVNSSLDVANLYEAADSMSRQTSLQTARQALSTWTNKCRQVARLADRADAIYDDRATVQAWLLWYNHHSKVQQLSNDADLFIDVKSKKIQDRNLRTWRMRMFRLNSLTRDADMFFERVQQDRFKLIFRSWIAKAHDSPDTLITETPTAATAATASTLVETPSKSKLELSSIDRWRQIRSTPRKSTLPSTPIRNGGSKLRHQIFNTPM